MSAAADLLFSVFFRQCSAFAALTCVVCDGVTVFGQEYKYIWRSPLTSAKWLYLFSRYFGLIAQMWIAWLSCAILFNNARARISCIFVAGPLARPPVKSDVCKLWFIFQIISGRPLFSALEIFLSLRIYALYNRSYSIALLLGFCISIGPIVTIIYGINSIPTLLTDSICNPLQPPHGILYVSTAIIVTHSVLWVLTIKQKSFSDNIWGSNPIVRLVTRDGAWVFIIIILIFIITIPHSFVKHMATHVVFSWPMALVSILTCRLILNMQSLKFQTSTLDPEFTSDIAPSLYSL